MKLLTKRKNEAKFLFKNYEGIWEVQENNLETIWPYIKGYHIQMDDYGNVTVSNRKDGSKLPAFCCHLDTVQKGAPTLVLAAGNVLFSKNKYGVGGDDKCGIVACFELLKRVPCKVIFFREEERGAIGSREYDQSTLVDNQFLIEIDRKGNKDIIQNSGGQKLCSDAFIKRLKPYFPGYDVTSGIFTDVNVLTDVGINMLNISCGYYNPHTENEYVILEDLYNTIAGLVNFTKNYKIKEVFERKAAYPSFYTGTTYSRTLYPEDELKHLEEEYNNYLDSNIKEK